MKDKKEYVCEVCAARYSKWNGFCNSCKQWNTIGEVTFQASNTAENSKLLELSDISSIEMQENEIRYLSGISEFDRVCGGGIVQGSVILIGGDPGIGKSTLLLQTVSCLAEHLDCIYFSGEESVKQIKLRYDRINNKACKFWISAATSLDDILLTIREKVINKDISRNKLIVIDSIQTLSNSSNDSFAGSVTQIKSCTQILVEFAKKNNITVIIVGHVTKDGMIAGPKLLEHMVDTVLYLEGDKINNFRLLRSIKNRYGPSDEIGVFEMRSSGLFEIKNPSSVFINKRDFSIPGVVTFPAIEGSRVMMLEIQTLLVDTNFPAPRRSVVGIDINRLYVILAVLESICKISFAKKDVYVSVVAGIKISDPAVDFAVAASLLSSYKKQAIPNSYVIFGEIGLTGEIRNIMNAALRIKEAEKLGFHSCITSELHRNDGENLTLFRNILLFYNDFFA